ncbi:DUF4326 domain-containing protein [Mesorhizobium sp. L-8-3]|uniref:DUF4326 domain-containing protein n=1 Tax=Mesorhizobium sp. L-8-3 TaxID=2744522 RepID=UPI001928F989|nr:DUF4326 domain-containing protein [Mesorhizobium sp. L-8-3]BCH21539.1 hypothetical protein MesoLjLb_13240 [Mesorhizobium sp. L-8-3]
MCKVLNNRVAGVPAGAAYIGRGSKWGNPFRIGPGGDRAAVIAKHERWLANQHGLLRSLDELRGHDLVCTPLACHGDLLRRLANASRDQRLVAWDEGRGLRARGRPGRVRAGAVERERRSGSSRSRSP